MIVYEDNHVLVANKPSELLTQPSPKEADSLETRLKALIKTRDSKPGGVFLEAVHRLDKPASGLVVFAKTTKALKRLNEAQREGKFRKFYRARVEGTLAPKKGVLENYLVHGPYKAQITASLDPKGKKASLKYRMQGDLVEIELLSGRYHQIRAQLSHAGCPLVGDKKYGSRSNSSIYLNHYRVEFPHPTKNETVKVFLKNSF